MGSPKKDPRARRAEELRELIENKQKSVGPPANVEQPGVFIQRRMAELAAAEKRKVPGEQKKRGK